MTTKAAFFVEGMTEQSFVAKLLVEYFGDSGLKIVIEKMSGGKRVPIQTVKVSEINPPDKSILYELLIVDCSGDGSVASYIKDRAAGLAKSGYTRFIGLLDLYPKPKSDLQKFRKGLKFTEKLVNQRIDFIISIMEIESWFLGENTHLERISSELSNDTIKVAIGIDLQTNSVEDIAHPARMLNTIYELVGYAYTKKAKQVQRTVDALDIARMVVELPSKIPSLGEFVQMIRTI